MQTKNSMCIHEDLGHIYEGQGDFFIVNSITLPAFATSKFIVHHIASLSSYLQRVPSGLHILYRFESQWELYLAQAIFSYKNSYYLGIEISLLEALNGRSCQSYIGWFDTLKDRPCGIDLLRESLDRFLVLYNSLQVAQSRQKSCTNPRFYELKFGISDRVFLYMSPMKGAIRFGKNNTYNPRYIGPFEIIQTVGENTYKLNLPL